MANDERPKDESRSRRRSNGETPSLPFFIGPENRMVEVVVQAILGSDTPRYNPVVLCGESGTGKSHLAHGLAAAYRAQHPDRPVICQAAVEFTRDLNDAIDAQATEPFRRRYRSAELLVVEDATRLADSPAAQRELVATLDAAVAAAHQVIVTASTPPGHWVRVLVSLQSRLEAGLCISLAPPGDDARLAILRDAATRRGLALSEPVARVLAGGPRRTTRDLLGSLVELHARQTLDGRPIDVEMARALVAEQRGRRSVALREIARATARAFDLPVGQLRGRSQRRAAVAARGMAIYLARRLTNMSLEQIGRYLGGRDHTTVLHSCRKTEELLREEATTQEILREVEAMLGNAPSECTACG